MKFGTDWAWLPGFTDDKFHKVRGAASPAGNAMAPCACAAWDTHACSREASSLATR